jgi:hypothetical protein
MKEEKEQDPEKRSVEDQDVNIISRKKKKGKKAY